LLKVLLVRPCPSVYLPGGPYGRKCDLRNGDATVVRENVAAVHVLFTFGSQSRYLPPLNSMKVQNVRIALQGVSGPVRY
jgi:hypothetical protein